MALGVEGGSRSSKPSCRLIDGQVFRRVAVAVWHGLEYAGPNSS